MYIFGLCKSLSVEFLHSIVPVVNLPDIVSRVSFIEALPLSRVMTE